MGLGTLESCSVWHEVLRILDVSRTKELDTKTTQLEMLCLKKK